MKSQLFRGVETTHQGTFTQAQLQLREMVLESVASPYSRRNYAKAIDDLFRFAAGRPLTRALLLDFRASMDGLAPSTVNVRLSAVRKLVVQAHRNGSIPPEEAADLTQVSNLREKGTILGSWLTREQTERMLAVPDRSTLKGKRDYCLLALLVGCALRRRELSELTVEEVQLREGRWMFADLRDKRGRVRSVVIPAWVRQGISVWQSAAHLEKGRLLRQVSEVGEVQPDGLSDTAIWAIVTNSAQQIGIERLGA